MNKDQTNIDSGTRGTGDIEDGILEDNFTPIFLGLIAYSATIAPSMSIGFSAVALPALLNPNNEHHLTASQASWVASIASVATPIGCFVSGPISDRFGRKVALLIINVVTFMGWVVIAVAHDKQEYQYPILLTGRLLTGLSTGLASMPAAVYMAEISSPALRGVFTTASGVFFAFGVMVVYCLGYIFKDDWGTISTVTAIIPCCAMALGMFLLPESPAWLVSKNRIDEASKSMRKIYGYKEHNQEIFEDVQALIRNRDASKISNDKPQKKTIATSLAKKLRYLRRPSCFKPFVLVLSYFFFQQFSGTFVIVFYAIDIVKMAGVQIDPYKAIVIIAFTRFIAAILVAYVSRRYGRRPPSILSGAGMTVCMFSLVIYLYLKATGRINTTTATELSWIPMLCLIAYFFTSTLGFLTMPFAMAAECFPAKVRGLATGLITCTAYIFNFIIVKIFPTMVQGMGPYGVFAFYGVACLFGTVFIVVLLPETKGKTLAEIEEYFSQKKPRSGEKGRPIIKS